ncbi:dematin-like isoform X2 [Stigmatopora argus]
MPLARVDAGGVPGREPVAVGGGGGGAMTPKRRQTSPGSILSQRGVPGSPAAAIVARVDDGVMLYKDLAALPRDKAILDIERPDLMTYEPRRQRGPPDAAERGPRPQNDGPAGGERSPSPTETRTPATTRHFHRPANGRDLYKKPPIYGRGAGSPALPVGKRLIIQSSKFPAARPPDPDAPSKMETDRWPCPPACAVFEQEKASRRSGRHPEEEEEDEDKDEEDQSLFWQELAKIGSNLGRMILRSEGVPRKTGSLPDAGPPTRTLPTRVHAAYFSSVPRKAGRVETDAIGLVGEGRRK